MGGKSGTPAAPDYRGAAAEQAQSSKEVTNMQTWANRPQLNTPWGQQTWDAYGGIDPATGQPITQWESNINLTPESQAALEAQQRIGQGRSAAAEGLLGQATDAFNQPFDYAGAPDLGTLESMGYDPQGARNRAEQAMFQRQVNLMEPGMTQSEDARRTRLANMGIVPEGGSAPWERAQQGMDANRQQMYSNAALNAIAGGGQEAGRELGLASGAMGAQNMARQQYLAEEAQKRGMPLNELNALLTGQQVQNPQMPNFAPAAASQANQALTAAGMQGQYNLGQQAQDASGQMDWGSLAGTVAGGMMGGPMGASLGGSLGSGLMKF